MRLFIYVAPMGNYSSYLSLLLDCPNFCWCMKEDSNTSMNKLWYFEVRLSYGHSLKL